MVRTLFWLAALLISITVSAPLHACAVPVFRYALERWRPSPYEVVVFHKGKMPADAARLVAQLEDPMPVANVMPTTVDLAEQVEPALRQLWEKQATRATLPWMVVRFPADIDGVRRQAWSGPLNKQIVADLLDSPARRRCVEQLTQGSSAVFVLLASGDQKADDSALSLLRRELTRLEKVIELPPGSKEDPELGSKLPLKVELPVLVVSRTSAEDRVLVAMLLASDDDLDKVRGPIVFPIYGRGRSLFGLYGPDLNADNLNQAARFLCGACSCLAKESNPGIDLLFSASWDELIAPVVPTETRATVPPVEPPLSAPSKTVTPAPAATPRLDRAEVPTGDRRWLWAAVGAAGLLVVITGAWLLHARQTTAGAAPPKVET